MNIIEQVEELNNQIAYLKENFAQYIKDKNIPLDVRWQLFLDAPANLRNTSRWIARFEGLPDEFIGYDCFVQAERHETVTVEWIMEMIEEILECPEDYGAEDLTIDIVTFKEDVLSRNLYSFTYDW